MNKNQIKSKSIVSKLLSLILLICLLPFIIGISIVIKLTSKGPIFFLQERIGINLKPFNIYKFRTMVVNAEEQKEQLLEKNEADGPVFKIKNDPRVTKIGKFGKKPYKSKIGYNYRQYC